MNRRLAVMPARGGSKRIPGKNILPFCGAPLMVHALRTARETALFDEIHVSTDDPAIAEVARAEGFCPAFLRDPALADDYTPLLPVLKWVLDQYIATGQHFGSVTLIMPTAPLIGTEDIIAAHRVFDRHGAIRGVLAVAPFPAPVEWAFRRGADDTLTPLQPGMDVVRSQDLPEAWYDSGTFLILPSFLLSEAAPMPSWVGFSVERWKAVDIDTPDDLSFAERLFRTYRKP